MSRIHVSSEIGTLKRVIVHRPDRGIDRLTPKRFDELLFDDIVMLSAMQREHDLFTQVLGAFVGKENVIEAGGVLRQTLEADAAARDAMLRELLVYEELPDSYFSLLRDLDDRLLADVLISGELQGRDLVLFDPIPNFIFTRDIAVTVNDHIVITRASKEARFRENFIMSYVFRTHPVFRQMAAEGRLIDLNDVNAFPPSRRGERVSVEGGDCMILNKDYLLIGRSERSSDYGIELLADALLSKGVVKNVAKVTIPSDRSFMHLDTVFTQISERHAVCYKPIIVDGLSSYVDVYGREGRRAHYPSVREFILEEIRPDMGFIPVGGGRSPYQEREQWTDGSNLVVVKAGVGITYDRNTVTEEAFRRAGYEVVRAADLLADFDAGRREPGDVAHTIITIPSYELSRARGGSHCMTLPIERADDVQT